MSPSEPTAIVPFFGQRPNIFAGFVEHELDEAVRVDLARAHPAVPEQHQARLDARGAVRDLREVVLAEELLAGLVHAERAVVGGDDLEVVLLRAPSRARPGSTSRAAAATSRTSRPRSRAARSRRRRGTGTAGRSRRRRAGPCRAPASPSRARPRRRGGRCRSGTPAISASAIARPWPRPRRAWAASARGTSARSAPLRSASFTSVSMTPPFSACMQTSPPFSRVLSSALKIVASSTMNTPG